MSLRAEQIEKVLDETLDAVLSSRCTAEEPAHGLAVLPAAQQNFALHWVAVIAKSNCEMAYQFALHAPRALQLLDTAGAREWALRALDVYDKEGLYPGSAALQGVDGYVSQYKLNYSGVKLDEVRAVLTQFVCALAGRDLKIAAGSDSYTDTETIYLPAQINHFNAREKNYQLYKLRAVMLWAQSWFGTFRRINQHAPHLNELLCAYEDQPRAVALFNFLETLRLCACIKRELPGLYRELAPLSPKIKQDATWQKLTNQLQAETATVAETLAATAVIYKLQLSIPSPPLYQGKFNLDAVQNITTARIARDKLRLQDILVDLAGDGYEQNNLKSDADEIAADCNSQQEGSAEARLPPQSESVLNSLHQDLDNIPPEWLTPAGGDYSPDDNAVTSTDAPSVQSANAFQYDEWDFRRQHYRKNWCSLKELETHSLYDDFAATTLQKYSHLITDIRRNFETLREHDKLFKAQRSGDEIDLDALVGAYTDAYRGGELSERIFMHKSKNERDMAVVFMVDISGSTKGWINDTLRESLLLLCEALEILGDRYAIYGFSGMTRNRCEIYRVKTFAQPYDEETRARISGLRPQDYTRMGSAIRHLNEILSRIAARTRLLITLSDGKPDDYDGYRGEYGIEDTRQALLESRNKGIQPFCITIDNEASDYLPRMYGGANYTYVDDARKLPRKVADIYRKITT